MRTAVELDDAGVESWVEPGVGGNPGSGFDHLVRGMRICGGGEQEVTALSGKGRQARIDEVVERVRDG